MQLRSVDSRIRQKDNSDVVRKAQLRHYFCRDVKRADIFLAGAGYGEMFKQVWRQQEKYVLAVDTNEWKINQLRFHFPNIDARVGDFRDFEDWPRRVGFRIADFDAFGDQYPGMRHFMESAPWHTPLDIIVGDSSVLAFKRSGHLPAQIVRGRLKGCFMGARDLDSYMDRFVWPWWAERAKEYALQVVHKASTSNREKTVFYYAIRLADAF
jgi:hypothetical protein